MATTPNLGLPLIDGSMTADVPRDFNALANAVDTAVEAAIDEAVAGVTVPDASLTQKGIVQLSNKTDGTSQTLASTEKAVSDARVAAINAAATDATTKANAAETNAKNASLPRTGGNIVGEGNVLALVGGTHVYQSFYPVGLAAGRKAYFGFSGAGAKNLELYNEVVDGVIKLHGYDIIFEDRTGATTVADLKQSVSNGKASVAAAITGKGVATAADAPFATMAANINAIQVGPKYATGSVNADATTLTASRLDGTSYTTNSITVSGLSFRPTGVIITRGTAPITSYSVKTRNATIGDYNISVILTADGQQGYYLRVSENSGSSFPAANLLINDIGFRLPVPSVGSWTWEAFGA